ncbi:MAG TPA: MarR family transcriptional regulator [Solirubrobacteraceae bacterium]
MSRSSTREQLLAELGDEVRASQRTTDVHDDVLCELLGVNRTDGRCLDILDQTGPMTAGQLAQASALSTGAVTAVVDRLERAGYARRFSDPADRRRVVVELTPAARERSWELMGSLATEGARLAEPYSDEQLQMFIEFARLGRALQERHTEWLRERVRERKDSPTGR